MGSDLEGGGDDVGGEAVRAVALARAAKRKAEKAGAEALATARKELMRKGKLIEQRRVDQAKKTMRSYFESNRGARGGQPLSMVFDGCMPEVPGAEPNSADEYPSHDSTKRLGFATLATELEELAGSSSASDGMKVISSKSPLITLSSESENAEKEDLREVDCDSESDNSDFEVPSAKRGATSHAKAQLRRSEDQKRYDRHRKFQTMWAAKLPWAEGIMASDGILHIVKCKVCSTIERKPCIMAPKSDMLFKHDGKRVAKKDMPQFKVKRGEHYVASQCKHRKNLKFYAAKPPPSVIQQMNNCTSLEARKKRVQFGTLFQILSDGRPMLEYENRVNLYKFLSVPDLPAAHWCDNSGWVMAGYMYKLVVQEMRKLISAARFLAVTVDEVTAVDNTSVLSVHVYIVKDWIRVPLLVALQQVHCTPNAENLTKLIMESVGSGGGLDAETVAMKLVSFGADGASTLQGSRSGVTVQVKEKHAPFSIGVHCMAHRCNLAFKALSNLGIFASIERLLSVTHAYFCKSPKRLEEFCMLAELTETKGLKLLKNVQTRWVSLIEPLRRILSEYRTLIYKMTADLEVNLKAEPCLVLLLDPYTLLGMCALLPLLEAIDSLVTFAQKRDVYICDFVAAVKVCQASLYRMYEDAATAYSCDEFWSFQNLLDCSHEQIHLKWMTDLNSDDSATLCFVCHGEQINAEHKGGPVDRLLWASLVATVKSECTAHMLVQELDERFPAHHVMNSFGIMYPQYWCGVSAEEMFDKNLRILMDQYGHAKILGSGDEKMLITPPIDRDALLSQRALFKTCMRSNARAAMLPPYDVNPLTKIWRVLDSNNNLTQNFGEFLKLAEIAMVHVIGSVEDERTFSSVGFLKSKLRNCLDDNIEVVVGMFSQHVYTLENFPYQNVFDEWYVSGGRGRYLTGS